MPWIADAFSSARIVPLLALFLLLLSGCREFIESRITMKLELGTFSEDILLTGCH